MGLANWFVTIYPGWWYTYPSEKYEFVRDDDIPNQMESHKIHVPNHQPVIHLQTSSRTSWPI